MTDAEIFDDMSRTGTAVAAHSVRHGGPIPAVFSDRQGLKAVHPAVGEVPMEYATTAGITMVGSPALARLGIPDEVVRGHYPGPIWFCLIVPDRFGGFSIAEDGILVLLLPVYSGGRGSEPVDLCAVTLDHDRHVYTQDGVGAILGYHQFDHAEIHQSLLRVHRDPIAWLASGSNGIAVADWSLAAPELTRLTALVCDDRDHADAVQPLLLEWGGCPALHVMKEKAA